jgi:hypothetical protein
MIWNINEPKLLAARANPALPPSASLAFDLGRASRRSLGKLLESVLTEPAPRPRSNPEPDLQSLLDTTLRNLLTEPHTRSAPARHPPALSTPTRFPPLHSPVRSPRCSPRPRSPLDTVRDLLHQPEPDVHLLRATKDFAKRRRATASTLRRKQAATALYYACIGAALTLRGQTISRLAPHQLRRGLAWTSLQPWAGPQLRRHAAAALNRFSVGRLRPPCYMSRR